MTAKSTKQTVRAGPMYLAYPELSVRLKERRRDNRTKLRPGTGVGRKQLKIYAGSNVLSHASLPPLQLMILPR